MSRTVQRLGRWRVPRRHSDDRGSPGPAVVGVERIMTRLVVGMRLSSAGIGGAVAFIGLAPPARPGWVLLTVAGLLGWSCLFAVSVHRRGRSAVLAAGDVIVVMLICLAHERLVAAQILAASAGTGWVDLVAGGGVFAAQFGMRQPIGLAAGLLITGAYAIGASTIGEASVVLTFQTLITAAIATMLRRAAAAADLALAADAMVREAAITRAAVRADERDHQRQLHDTVLATLTMVHTGGITDDSPALRQRAAADLRSITRLRAQPAPLAGHVGSTARLDPLLSTTALMPQPGLRRLAVTLEVPVIELPTPVVVGLVQCVAEALTNVARHAGTDSAQLTARLTSCGVDVVVSDAGVGFDPGAVAGYRRGLRESIHGRMRSIGGAAHVDSRPGAGTTILLRWPDEVAR